jgi:hypothetical protein
MATGAISVAIVADKVQHLGLNQAASMMVTV